MPDAAPLRSPTARANGIDLAYETFGSKADPAMLLIMGLGTQMLGWDAVFCQRLADRGYFVIRFDNRDIGQSTRFDAAPVPSTVKLMMAIGSGRRPEVPYTLDDMADDAVGLLDALGIGRAHVVGASMGSAIAQVMAMRHRDRMLTFTGIMGSTGNPKLPPPTPAALSILLAPPAVDEATFVAAYQRAWKVLRGGSFPEEDARDEGRARAVWARGHHPAGRARQFAAIVASGDRRASLKAVDLPALVIHGDADPLVPVEAGIDCAAAIPGATLKVVPRMGHALPEWAWPELVEAIAAHAR